MDSFWRVVSPDHLSKTGRLQRPDDDRDPGEGQRDRAHRGSKAQEGANPTIAGDSTLQQLTGIEKEQSKSGQGRG